MRRSALVVPILMALSAIATAQTVPTTIRHQGLLTDNTPQQEPIDGVVSMRFAIWNAVSGGTTLWQEPASGGLPVVVDAGRFLIDLGSDVALSPSVFTGASASRWLEITLNPDTGLEAVLSPRQAIAASGRTVRAEFASVVDSATSADTADTATDTAALGGVSASNWQRTLDTAPCPAGTFYSAVAADGTTTCTALTETDPQVASSGSGKVPYWDGSALVDSSIHVDGAGRVGINTSSPTTALDVNGRLLMFAGSNKSGKVLTATSSSGNASWRTAQPTVDHATSYDSGQYSEYASGLSGWRNLPIGTQPQVVGPGTFLVLASFAYRVAGGTGNDDLSFRVRSIGCSAYATHSTDRFDSDSHRDSYHTLTYHSILTIPDSCTNTLHLQYDASGTDDTVWWRRTAISAIRLGD